MLKHRRLLFATLTAVTLALGACSGDDGKDGADGTPGATGATGPAGTNGISCWDLNANGVADLSTEDVKQGRQGRYLRLPHARRVPTIRCRCTRATSPRMPTRAPASA